MIVIRMEERAWEFDTAYCVKMSDPDGDMDLGSLRETLTWG